MYIFFCLHYLNIIQVHFVKKLSSISFLKTFLMQMKQDDWFVIKMMFVFEKKRHFEKESVMDRQKFCNGPANLVMALLIP